MQLAQHEIDAGCIAFTNVHSLFLILALEERSDKKTMSDQYSEYDKIRKSGTPLPLADRPIVSRMTDRNLTLSWKPSIPKGPREPVTYRVEMCELPGGDWFDIRSGKIVDVDYL
jgi:hypothetical protein